MLSTVFVAYALKCSSLYYYFHYYDIICSHAYFLLPYLISNSILRGGYHIYFTVEDGLVGISYMTMRTKHIYFFSAQLHELFNKC